uniref:Uncharacterized protein n=1 Tax=Graphocephala atropunctata TaxID=36148 RepID=A0A1B6M2D5_9HEMI
MIISLSSSKAIDLVREKMIWTIVLMCLLHKSKGHLPSVAEIMARSRWCVGEGGKCPINLPLSFTSCCKPFICTAIPKTRKPTRFLKFSEYKEYKCLLPENSTTELPSELNDLVTTANTGQEGEDPTPLSMYSQMSDSADVSMVTNGSSHLQSGESQCGNDSSNSVQVFSQDDKNDENYYKYELVNETLTNDYETISSNADLPGDDTNGTETKLLVKRSTMNESSYLEEDMDSVTPRNSSSAINNTQQAGYESLERTDESEEVSDEVQNKKSLDVYNESSTAFNFSGSYFEHNKSDSLSLPTFGSAESLNTSVTKSSPDDILDTSVENISLVTNTSSKLLANVSSAEDSEEDWHSSQMKYDSRPLLHKVVSIPPFHLSNFFQSVEVVKLNASIENSLESK